MLVHTLNLSTTLAGIVTCASDSCNCMNMFLCRSGAAIVAEIRNSLSVFDKEFFNPLCFMQYYNSSVPFNEINHEVSENIYLKMLYVYIHLYRSI